MTTALELIQRRSALSRGFVADRSPDRSLAERGWRRMGILLNALDNPQLAYRTVHVAGSKGKGTTAYVVGSLLQSAGLRTGRYVSPHLLNWNERIAVDDESIADPDFERLLAQVDSEMSMLEQALPTLGTFNAFELLTATAFLQFRDQQCHVAVIEVGLGGRFDSTNHLSPAATIITRIEMEHVDVLGPTLAEITWNKAGIVRQGVPVVVSAQDPVAIAVIEAEAATNVAPVLLEDRDWSVTQIGDAMSVQKSNSAPIPIQSPLPGAHNRSNIGAALIAARTVIGVDFDPVAASAALAQLRIPGRFDQRIDPRTGRSLILDGAHTAESIAALITTAQDVTGASRFPMIISLLSDKPADELLKVIAPHAISVAFPVSPNPRAWPPSSLAEMARNLGLVPIAVGTLRDAVDQVSAGTEPVLITGSFGIVADGLRMLATADLPLRNEESPLRL